MRALVLIGAFIGALCLMGSFFLDSAPQQAAMAATACAFAIVPYVAFRVGQLEAAALEKKVFFEHVRKRLEDLLEAKK